MANDDIGIFKEINLTKLSMSTATDNKAPASRAAHIADGGDAAANATAVNAILVVLENLGLVETS